MKMELFAILITLWDGEFVEGETTEEICGVVATDASHPKTTRYCQMPYMFPRVFGDEFDDSLDFMTKLVTYLVMISVNHRIWQ